MDNFGMAAMQSVTQQLLWYRLRLAEQAFGMVPHGQS
jgi:hypothetical protein